MKRHASLQLVIPEHPEVSSLERQKVIATIHDQHARRIESLFEATDAIPEQMEERRRQLADAAGGRSAYQEARQQLEARRYEEIRANPDWPEGRVRPAARRSARIQLPSALSMHDPVMPKPQFPASIGPIDHPDAVEDLMCAKLLGSRSEYSWETLGTFDATPYEYLNPEIGRIVNQVVLRNSSNNPTDNDYATITNETALGFWYTTSETGKVQADAKLNASPGLSAIMHTIGFDDRSGFSDGWAYQQSSLFMSVNGFEDGNALSSKDINDKTDGFWQKYKYHEFEGPYWFSFVSSQTWPANTRLYIEIGVRNYANALMNDVYCNSSLSCYWDVLCVRMKTL